MFSVSRVTIPYDSRPTFLDLGGFSGRIKTMVTD